MAEVEIFGVFHIFRAAYTIADSLAEQGYERTLLQPMSEVLPPPSLKGLILLSSCKYGSGVLVVESRCWRCFPSECALKAVVLLLYFPML